MEYAGVSLIDQRDIFCYDGSDNPCRMFCDKGYILLSYVFYGVALHINEKITTNGTASLRLALQCLHIRIVLFVWFVIS